MTTVRTDVDLSVQVGPVRLPSPITLASGTCGYGTDLADWLDVGALGAVFTKGLTLAPRDGHPTGRIAEVPAGMLNRIGLQNVGIDAFLADKLPPLVALGVPVFPNLAGATVAEYVALAEHLSAAQGLAGLELNVSCPNVDAGGLEFGTDPRTLEGLVAAVRAVSPLPLVVKLSPAVPDVGELARAAEAGGADALSAINTLPAMAVTPRLVDGRLVASTRPGGLSGPALKPLALRCVAQAVRASRLPVIGIGGVASLQDVLEFLAVGARAVQVGTATFLDPGTADRLRTELSAWVADQGAARLEALLP